MRADLDAHPVSPYTVLPMRQAGPVLPQDGKRPPRPPQPSGIPVETGVPLMPSTMTEFGPPPSYESPRDDRRVGVAQ